MMTIFYDGVITNAMKNSGLFDLYQNFLISCQFSRFTFNEIGFNWNISKINSQTDNDWMRSWNEHRSWKSTALMLALITRFALTVISRRPERRNRGVVLRRRLDLDAWFPSMKARRIFTFFFFLSVYCSCTLSSLARGVTCTLRSCMYAWACV